jgi:hypothetical protein
MNTERTLNKSCSFGNRSTRFIAGQGLPIDINESKEANLQIMRVLNNLADEIKKRDILWQPVSLDTYDNIAEVSNRISGHSPATLAEVLPISRLRTVDFIFNSKIKSSRSQIAKNFTEKYSELLPTAHTKKDAAKLTLGYFQKNLQVLAGDTYAKIVNEDKTTVNITDEDHALMLDFQDMQERFESEEDVEALNNLPQLKKMLEIILGIQMSIVKVLDAVRQSDPEWFVSNSVAFEEFAILDEQGSMVPSSRLLKLIVHNMGHLFTGFEDEVPPETILFNAFSKALRTDVFHQKICVFKKVGDKFILDSIVDKVCPARKALVQIMLNRLRLRITNDHE